MSESLENNTVKGSGYDSFELSSPDLAVILCTKNSGSTIENVLINDPTFSTIS